MYAWRSYLVNDKWGGKWTNTQWVRGRCDYVYMRNCVLYKIKIKCFVSDYIHIRWIWQLLVTNRSLNVETFHKEDLLERSRMCMIELHTFEIREQNIPSRLRLDSALTSGNWPEVTIHCCKKNHAVRPLKLNRNAVIANIVAHTTYDYYSAESDISKRWNYTMRHLIDKHVTTLYIKCVVHWVLLIFPVSLETYARSCRSTNHLFLSKQFLTIGFAKVTLDWILKFFVANKMTSEYQLISQLLPKVSNKMLPLLFCILNAFVYLVSNIPLRSVAIQGIHSGCKVWSVGLTFTANKPKRIPLALFRTSKDLPSAVKEPLLLFTIVLLKGSIFHLPVLTTLFTVISCMSGSLVTPTISTGSPSLRIATWFFTTQKASTPGICSVG